MSEALDPIPALPEVIETKIVNGVAIPIKSTKKVFPLVPAREGTQVFDRIKGETTKAHEAWCIYRDLGRVRSQEKVAEEVGKNPGLIARWSARYQWVERAAEYDAHVARLERIATEEARAQMNERHASTAQALLGKALRRLQSLNVEELDARDVRNFIVAATELERKARGAPDETVKHEHTADGEVQVKVRYTGDWHQQLKQ